MLRIDLVGLALSALLIGPRYAHLVLGASVLSEMGRVLAALTLGISLDGVRAAGVFGGLAPANAGHPAVDLAGPAMVLVTALGLADGKFPPWRRFLDPVSRSDRPAVDVFLRFFAVAAVIFIVRRWAE